MDPAAQLASVQERIAAACGRAGRAPSEVTLLAVSKNHPPAAVAAVAALGVADFGESRVQEAKAKIPACPGRLRWHLIGHLQTNKARDAAQLFDLIHSVDSPRVAEELQKQADRLGRRLRVLVEVNVAAEAAKSGYAPGVLLAGLAALDALPRLEIHGLMGMAPWSPDPERARPVFRRLRELHAECGQRLGAPLPVLSMGMSGDFEVAIEEGSTLVRIGTALFGERPRHLPPAD